MSGFKTVYQLILGYLLCTSLVYAAQGDHQPLAVSDDLRFKEIFTNTLRNSPEYREGTVRQAQADAYSSVGKGWLSGVPSLQLNYTEDMFLDNVGRSQLAYSIQLPVWGWGEKRKAAAQGEHYQEQVQLWEAYLEYSVVGMVRNSLADLAEADAMLAVEKSIEKDAESLLELTEALQEAGEVALLDVFQAKNRLLEQIRNVLDAEAFLVDAEREYEVISGMRTRPGYEYVESLSSREEIDESHPVLRLLASEITLAEDNITASERSTRGNPQLSIGTFRQQDYSTDPVADVVSISLSVPIGGQSIVSARSSSARRQKVDAEVKYHSTYRNLNRALHEVEHELFLTNEDLILADDMESIARQQWQMARTAYELGETTMAQVVLALQQSRQTAKELQRLQLYRERLITQYNQLTGEMP